MNDIKPIETFYNGYRFRSRLEARWAVFFDALGVEYEYEPEGFKLPSGKTYLPDFRVKCHGCRGSLDSDPFDLWIEVKGVMTSDDAAKIEEFAITEVEMEDFIYEHVSNPVLIVGNIPPKNGSYDSDSCHAYERADKQSLCLFNYELIDGDYFAAYPAAHNGKFYLWGDDSNYIVNEDVPVVERAYEIARQARFEHGEKPNVYKKALQINKTFPEIHASLLFDKLFK